MVRPNWKGSPSHRFPNDFMATLWVEATLPNLVCSGLLPGTWSILSTLLQQLSCLEEKVQISNTNCLVCAKF